MTQFESTPNSVYARIGDGDFVQANDEIQAGDLFDAVSVAPGDLAARLADAINVGLDKVGKTAAGPTRFFLVAIAPVPE